MITSRRHLGDLPGAAVQLLLPTLSHGQAREMFLRLAPQAAAGSLEELADLVRLAGYLPLAISLLARVCARHPSWSLADLATETRASMLTLAAERDSVAAAFGVSYRHLAAGYRRFSVSSACTWAPPWTHGRPQRWPDQVLRTPLGSSTRCRARDC